MNKLSSRAILVIAIVGTAIATAAAVSAQGQGCYYNGELYPVGTTFGSFVCTPDGWKPRPK